MIRKSSYFVRVPSTIQISISSGVTTRIIVKGLLGAAHIAIKSRSRFYLEGNRLSWEQLAGVSRRSKRILVTENNNLKKHFSNIFFRLGIPDTCHFKMVGRGYRVTSSKRCRSIALELGYTSKKIIPLPPFVNVRVLNRYEFELSSIDSTFLRTLSLRIRSLRPPNPYTSKGIFLNNEVISTKQGKKTQY